MFKLFKRKPDVSDAARLMGRQAHMNYEAKRRENIDQMRRDLGLPAHPWRKI